MNKVIRILGPWLILLGMISAFYLTSRLQLSAQDQTVVQILILVGTCWLAWQWVTYNEMSNLREVSAPEEVRYHYRLTSLMEDAERWQVEPINNGLNGAQNAVHRGVTSMLVRRSKSVAAYFSPKKFAHALISIGVVSALTAVMYLIGVRILGEGVIALLYLVPIGWCTVRWGQVAGVTAAVTAALSFDYLFIPPYRTFNIGSLEGWLLLFLFIGMAILIVGRIHSIITEERYRERKATFLYEVVAAISRQATREGVAQAIVSHIQEKYQAEFVRVNLIGGWGYSPYTAYEKRRQSFIPGGKPDRALPIDVGTARIGEIAIWQGTIPLPSVDDPMLQTMLKQIAAAFNRVRVAEGKAPYPLQKPSYSDGNSFQTSRS